MRTSYVAFGLDLRSTFRMVGMRPRGPLGLPRLALDLASKEQLDAIWDGARAVEQWSGRLGDQRRLTIQRGEGGDRLFSYGEHARFHLAANGRRLACVCLRDGPGWQRALIGKIVPSIAVMRGYEALHAAGIQSPSGALVALAGPSSSGKSTLAAELISRGWTLLADDELTLARDDLAVCAHPGSPHMNVGFGASSALDSPDLATPLATLAGERWTVVARAAEEPRPVEMICLLERGDGRFLGTEVLPANPLALAPYMLGLDTTPTRQRARFELYADLSQQAKLVRLTGARRSTPAELAEHVQEALEAERAPLAGSAR